MMLTAKADTTLKVLSRIEDLKIQKALLQKTLLPWEKPEIIEENWKAIQEIEMSLQMLRMVLADMKESYRQRTGD